MSRIKRGEVPARLRGVQRRFDQWRRAHRVRSRLPESLWDSAVTMAHAYGIHRTAKALRLDYYSLKKRIEPRASAATRVKASAATRVKASATAATRVKAPATAAGGEGNTVPTFLELSPLGRMNTGECILELEDGEGAKMRVHLKGHEVPDLAALARGFWDLR